MTEARVLETLRAHGWNATSFQVLEAGFEYWFDPDGRGVVGYVDTGAAWVAGGAPLAADADLEACGRRFCAAARAAGRRVCFFAVEDRFCENAPWLARVAVGEQPSWDPSLWHEVVRSTRGLREQLRRARAKGVQVRELDADELSDATSATRQSAEALVRTWLASRRIAPMGFLVDVQIFGHPRERRYFAAEHAGRMVALLVAVPVYARTGWLFEDLLRAPDAPNGTTELLVDHAMRAVADRGSTFATLGLVPLAGDVPAWLRVARASTRPLYDFRGVERFRAKLRPHGTTPIHLAWPRADDASTEQALIDALAAFTIRGTRGERRASFVRFALDTALHLVRGLWLAVKRRFSRARFTRG